MAVRLNKKIWAMNFQANPNSSKGKRPTIKEWIPSSIDMVRPMCIHRQQDKGLIFGWTTS